jgi:transaldolase
MKKNKTLELYADGIPPDVDYINKIIDEYGICGFTCNPTLIKQYLPMSYYDYCKIIIDNSRNFPVSIQVLTSDLDEMIKEAKIISCWGKNIYVKIPIVNEYGKSCASVIKKLLEEKIKVNITSIFTYNMVYMLLYPLPTESDYILSIFSGRLGDLGKTPNKFVIKDLHKLLSYLPENSRGKILWAGARQVLDIFKAEKYCDIITLPKAVLDKMELLKKAPEEYCVETVQMFARDAKNFTL